MKHEATDKLMQYEEALTWYKTHLHEGCALYQIGAVNIPGQSDIDLIIIVEKAKMIVLPKVPKKYKFIFQHDPIVMEKKMFRNITMLLPFYKLEHIRGEIIPIGKKQKYASELILLHWFNQYYPRELAYYLFKDKRCTRESLSALKRVSLTVSLLTSHNTDFVKRVVDLRRNWKNETNNSTHYKMYRALVEEGFILLHTLAEELNQKLSEYFNIDDTTRKFVSASNSNIYLKEWTAAKAMQMTKEIWQSRKVLVSVLPIHFYILIPPYAKIGQYSVENCLLQIKNHEFKNDFDLRLRLIGHQVRSYQKFGKLYLNPSNNMFVGLSVLSLRMKAKIFIKKLLLLGR